MEKLCTSNEQNKRAAAVMVRRRSVSSSRSRGRDGVIDIEVTQFIPMSDEFVIEFQHNAEFMLLRYALYVK